ncbi:MAG: hypothetical protein PHW10_05760 [Candidatus Peribacteraceae bacterium]|nr:hypothetical protein [Candidatus Peribacteraceae bacterium]
MINHANPVRPRAGFATLWTFRASAALLGLFLIGTTTASAAIGDWQKGASVGSAWDGDFATESFRQSLRDMREAHANFVTLVIPYEQTNIHTTDIRKRGYAPTDEALASAIDFAHSIGLQVNLMPHLDPADDTWRIYINPGNRDEWFKNYEDVVLLPLARMAQEHGVEMLTLGVELGAMTMASSNGSNDWHWRETIKKVRNAYTGILTYSAQHDDPNEKADIGWWDAVDYIGISAYHTSGLGWGSKSVEELRDEWKRWYDSALRPLVTRFGKPIIFPEIGFKSVPNAHVQPAAWWWGGGYDPQEQARNYEAVFQAFADNPDFKGIHWWGWKSDPNAGGEGNEDYTPQGKPAEEVMRRYFGMGEQAETPQEQDSASSAASSDAVSSSSVSSVAPETASGQEQSSSSSEQPAASSGSSVSSAAPQAASSSSQASEMAVQTSLPSYLQRARQRAMLRQQRALADMLKKLQLLQPFIRS